MAGFGYNNNDIRNQENFKPIANGNVADLMTYLPILARLSIPHYQKAKVQCKLREVNVIHFATLSKNQLDKHKNQINKVPTMSK